MKMHRNIVVLALGALVSASALGCGSDDDEPIGTLQQNWTIASSTTPEACANATQMRLVVVDSFGFTDATQFAPCSAFRMTLTLVPDRYTGTATFLGADGLPVSRTLVLAPFTIIEGQTTTETVDFSLSDFLAK